MTPRLSLTTIEQSASQTALDQNRMAIECSLITLTVILSIEIFQVFGQIAVPYPGAFLLAAVAFAALRVGFKRASISLAMAVCYEWWHFAGPGGLFHYTPRNLVRVAIFTLLTPLAAVVLSKLRYRVAQAAVSMERHQLMRELVREQERLESLIQSLPLGLLVVDSARNVVLSNPQMSTILRHPPEEFCHPSCERIFDQYRESFMPGELPVACALAGKAVTAEEVLYLRGDKMMVSLRMTADAVRDESGAIIGASVIIEDISQEKLARHASQEMAALVSVSDDAICSISKEGLILTWNRAAEQLLGYLADEARYMNIEALMPADVESELHGVVRAVQNGKALGPFATSLLGKDGSSVRVSVRMSPVVGRKRTEIIGAVLVAHALEEEERFHAASCAA